MMQDDWDRKVIPRWRSAIKSSSLPENLPSKKVKEISDGLVDNAYIESITTRVKNWKENKNIGKAADLLNFGNVKLLRQLLQEPAEYIFNNDEVDSVSLKELAAEFLGIDARPIVQNKEATFSEKCNMEIKRLKTLLHQNPGDAITLIDLARLYTILGHEEKAKKAIITATSAAPHHRFVLRSASRFYIHSGNPERALHLLNKTERTKSDTWLIASHISVESIMDKSPRYIKRGRQLLSNVDINPVHIAELGAAIATVFLNDGYIKEAKRTFNKALVNPNENAVAQVIWASAHFQMPINFRDEWMNGQYSYEANFYKAQADSDFELALGFAEQWYEDEPFSTRPLRGLAFVCSILGRHSQAEEYTRQVLKRDPNQIGEINNLIFSLASQNKIEDASQYLSTLVEREKNTLDDITGHTIANIGLVNYRNGYIEEGRLFYEKALKFFLSKKQEQSYVLAYAFWAREALLASDEKLQTIIRQAKIAAEKVFSPGASIVLSQIVTDAENTLPVRPVNSTLRDSKIWTHDANKNILTIKAKAPFKVKN